MADQARIDSIQRQPFHRVHRTFFVGLFSLIPAVMIPAFVVYTLGKADFFQEWRQLRVVYSSSYGVSRGDAVTISDIRVGYVSAVDLTEEGRAVVSFRVLMRHAPLLRKNSRALLRQKNILFGDWLIALTLGSAEYAVVEENDTLVGEPPMRLDKVIGQLTSMISTFEDILDEVNQGHGLLGELVKGDSLVTAVQQTVQEFKSLARIATRTARRFDETAVKFGGLSDAWEGVSDSLVVVMQSVEPAILEAKTLIVQLQQTGEKLPPVMEQALVDLQEIEVLLRGLQKHWLFNRAVRKGKEDASADSTSPE